MRHLLTPFLLLAISLACTSCSLGSSPPQQSADQMQAARTAAAMAEADRQIGMPAIVNFQERKLAKMIFELRDQENLITYAYIINHMTGELVFIGKCVGYGLPYSVQYTNPERVDKWYATSQGGGGGLTLPQADPNGLFMPAGLSATWLMLIDPRSGDPRPVYIEPEIIVSPFPLHGGAS